MNYDYNVDFLSSPHTVEREASRRSQYSHDNIRSYLGGKFNRIDMDVEDEVVSFPPSRVGSRLE